MNNGRIFNTLYQFFYSFIYFNTLYNNMIKHLKIMSHAKYDVYIEAVCSLTYCIIIFMAATTFGWQVRDILISCFVRKPHKRVINSLHLKSNQTIMLFKAKHKLAHQFQILN